MIRTFADKDTERFFLQRVSIRKFRSFERVALVRLNALHAAKQLADLDNPGLRLKKLASRGGQYSIRINDRYRICFRWDATDAYEVEIVDYH